MGTKHSGKLVGKWRCLKEQRKKFAITMTVIIEYIRVCLAVVEVPFKRGWEYSFPMQHVIFFE